MLPAEASGRALPASSGLGRCWAAAASLSASLMTWPLPASPRLSPLVEGLQSLHLGLILVQDGLMSGPVTYVITSVKPWRGLDTSFWGPKSTHCIFLPRTVCHTRVSAWSLSVQGRDRSVGGVPAGILENRYDSCAVGMLPPAAWPAGIGAVSPGSTSAWKTAPCPDLPGDPGTQSLSRWGPVHVLAGERDRGPGAAPCG